MKVGILGTGDVGKALGNGFLATGHQVIMGSRSASNESALEWAKEGGAEASVGTFADAVAASDLIVFAVKGVANPDVVKSVGADKFAGKVVIDATNPLDFSAGYPDLAIKGADSGGETLQRLLPKAKVVKAFNTVNFGLMFRPTLEGGPPDMFIAGDDDAAKQKVSEILTEFGWQVIDTGPIRSARWLEAMCMAWVMACMARQNWSQAFKLLR
jgi:predicted dinucleotide-binding enzyme